MDFLGGLIFLVAGIVQLAMRGRVLRPASGSQNVFSPRYRRFARTAGLVAGVVWLVLGVLIIAALAAGG